MNIKNLVVCSVLSSLSLIGCVAEPVDGSDAAEAEDVAEGAAAIIGPGGGDDTEETRVVTLACSIGYSSLFNPRVQIKNNSAFDVPPGAQIYYTVRHFYGDPGPRSGTTVGPLNKGATKYISLAYPGSLNADPCTASAEWLVP
jgi:hypothetical protein